MSIFRVITLGSLLKVGQCFGGKCRLHLQDRKINQARDQGEIGLFFDHDNRSDIFLRNFG
jgi:hypothetical protein